MSSDTVIWHDLECGTYTADLPYWHSLARDHPGAVLDIGAGTGRVALSLARAGHAVVALERDATLAGELSRRAADLTVDVRCADACAFVLEVAVSLAIVPMQTIHLLEDRAAFFRCARAALGPRGLLAIALLGDGVEPFELELEPDTVQVGAARYESTPTALRRGEGVVVLERRRSRIHDGAAQSSIDLMCLSECDGDTLVAQAHAVGFAELERHVIPPTRDHAGSEIVVLGVAA